jgi:TrpR-related protein YerC/YecD
MSIEETSLYQAILLLKTQDECQRFFTDLCTPQELAAMQERWRVCQLLETSDLSYRDIHQKTGTSLTTIGRVARFLREESYKGYKLVLDRINMRNADA